MAQQFMEEQPGNSINGKDQALQEQFSLLFRQYEHRLYTFACKTVQSELLARDIVQDVFIKLWSKKEYIDQISDIEDYLYKMVRNRTIDILRQLANDRRLREEFFARHDWHESKTGELLEIKEFQQVLAAAISNLPPQRRIIYQLSQVEGMSRQEIASQLQISPHTVKNQLTAALQTLRRLLSGQLKLF